MPFCKLLEYCPVNKMSTSNSVVPIIWTRLNSLVPLIKKKKKGKRKKPVTRVNIQFPVCPFFDSGATL